MNNPLTIILFAILGAGVVIIAVFWGSMQPMIGYKDQTTVCMNSAAVSCKATGQLPHGWYVKSQNGLSCWEAASGFIVNGTGAACADYGINI